MSKKSDFFHSLDNSVWDFIRQLDRDDLSGLELTQGTGWSRYLLKNRACSIAIVTMQDGILLSAWTDLNPTVRELDYYTYQEQDDHDAIIRGFLDFLTVLWTDSLERERHVRLFGIRWPRMTV